MVNLARVKIWNHFVGAVAWNEQREIATFEFDPGFLKLGLDISPVAMPFEEVQNGKRIFSFPRLNRDTFRGLPGLLADSLPDRFGNKLIEAWLANQGRSSQSFNPVEHLCYTGTRGMGALEYEPIIQPFDNESTALEIEELVTLAQEILNEKTNLQTSFQKSANEGLSQIVKVGTSAGGARAKAVIAFNKKTREVRSGQIDGLKGFNYWIIKFDGVTNTYLGDPKGYGKIEYAYYKMAIDCGIRMEESRLLEEKKRFHFMTKRFDRHGSEKLHMQTLCALAHFDYNDPRSYSYEQAFQIMRQLRFPYPQAEELFRRMSFNVIARNQDDHTKNISFLMDKDGNWELSPAYDATYAFDPDNTWMKAHQMSINGKRTNILMEDLLTVAKNLSIKKPMKIIDRIFDVVQNWPNYAKNVDIPVNQTKAIGNTHIKPDA